MLFSFYASFRWSRKGKYLLKMTVFTLFLSILSAFWFPLSFPFYSASDFRRIKLSEPYLYSQKYLWAYEVRFFANSAFELIPQGFVQDGAGGGEGFVKVTHYAVLLVNTEVGSISVGFEFVLFVLFFFLINITGALLGFVAAKDRSVSKLGGVSIRFLLCVVLGAAVLGIGIWLLSGAIVPTGPSTRYYFSYDPFTYIYDGVIFITAGIAWLLVISVDTTRRNFPKIRVRRLEQKCRARELKEKRIGNEVKRFER